MIRLCEHTECTGCMSCQNICPKAAITMREDANGFLYPSIDIQTCTECGLCQKVCPSLSPVKKWAKAEKPIAALAKAASIRRISSSGGMFSLLSKTILEENGLIFGATFTSDYGIIHSVAQDIKSLAPLRGSKYAQSSIGNCYQQAQIALKEGRKVLFSGTPCQIAGLRKFLRNCPTDNLFTIDVICHGVPSAKAFQTYLDKLADKLNLTRSDIQDFQFRTLWKWDIIPSFILNNIRHDLSQEENLYMRLFLTSRLHRECCYQCPFATPERVSDITLGDFWGIGHKHPYPYDTQEGCSLVLINNEKGASLFNKIKNELSFEKREWSEALRRNSQLRVSSTRPKDREKALFALFNLSYDEIYNQFFNTPWARFRHFGGSIIRKLKQI